MDVVSTRDDRSVKESYGSNIVYDTDKPIMKQMTDPNGDPLYYTDNTQTTTTTTPTSWPAMEQETDAYGNPKFEIKSVTLNVDKASMPAYLQDMHCQQ